LSLTIDKSLELVKRRIEVLCGHGWCQVHNKKIKATSITHNILGNDLKTLVNGVIYRIEVREGDRAIPHFRKVLSQIIEDVLITRGWDLGAHYAGASKKELPNILHTITASVDKNAVRLSKSNKEEIALACFDLFQNPDEAESSILAELGRVTFALQLIINTPCSVVAHSLVLPEHIYLDASFLMPAIVDGHPYRTLYIDAMNRLIEAAQDSHIDIKFYVAEEFLNEVISHRNLALAEVDNMALESHDALSKHILYHRSENVNIFIAAYGNWVERIGKKISFSEFLNRVAPYRTENELSKYLDKFGIETINLTFRPDEYDIYSRIKNDLISAYEADRRSWYDRKHEILIEHEARQLAQLIVESNKRIKSLFVTSDIRLRRLATDFVSEKPGKFLISHRGLVQLVDLLVGVRGDPIVTGKLFWGAVAADDTIHIRDFLINIALKYRDEAMTMSLSEVLQNLVPKSVNDAKKRQVSLFPGGSTDNKIRTSRFLDSLESQFYANMAEVIKRRFPDEYNLAEELRVEHLRKSIQKTRDLIDNFKMKIQNSDDPKDQSLYESEIIELKKYLAYYESELP
jgi:hypothetical protein